MIPLSTITLLKQGSCCGNGCLNCPYIPKHSKGTKRIEKSYKTAGIKSLSGIEEVLDMWNDGTRSELVRSITKTCEEAWASGLHAVRIDLNTDIKPYSEFSRILYSVLMYLKKSRDWENEVKLINHNHWQVTMYYRVHDPDVDVEFCILIVSEEDD